MIALPRTLLRRQAAMVAVILLGAVTGAAGQTITAQPPGASTPVVQTSPRPITLLEALTMAAQNSHALRVAAFEVTVARSQVNQAEALRRGQLTLGASYTRVNDRTSAIVIPAGTLPPPLDTQTITIPIPFNPNIYQVGVTYQVPLYTGGRNEAQMALAQANLKGAEAVLERVKQQVVFDVKQAYYSLLLAQAGIDVAQRTTAAAEENLRVSTRSRRR
jgi:outer membrane protein